MFERDAQEPLDHFQMGHTDEAEFLREANAWPEYARDYKPLVDFAIAQSGPWWRPTCRGRLRPRVAEGGLGALSGRARRPRRPLVAADVPCPTGDEYYTRFVDAMGGRACRGARRRRRDSGRARSLLPAQCVKDETMAESIAQAHAAGGRSAARGRSS